MAKRLTDTELATQIRILNEQIIAKQRENIDPDTRAADLRVLRNTLSRKRKAFRERMSHYSKS